MQDTPDLAVVIVSYKVRGLLRRCLASVLASDGGLGSEVYVVDNASHDGSAEMVRAEFPGVRLITSDHNGGFPFANNLALRLIRETHAAWPRYVLLLNPDTELDPTALARMVEFLDDHPEAGAAGPKLVRPDGSLDLACRRSFPSPEVSLYRMIGLSRLLPRSRRFGRYNLTFLDPDEVSEVDSVVGAFMMVRGALLDQVGLLDEGFFMYGEDLDWAYRMKARGWRVLYNGRVSVLHHKGASSGQRSRQSTVEFYRAMLVFFRKHYADKTCRPLRWAVVFAINASASLALLRGAVLGRRPGLARSPARGARA